MGCGEPDTLGAQSSRACPAGIGKSSPGWQFLHAVRFLLQCGESECSEPLTQGSRSNPGQVLTLLEQHLSPLSHWEVTCRENFMLKSVLLSFPTPCCRK